MILAGYAAGSGVAGKGARVPGVFAGKRACVPGAGATAVLIC